MFRKALRKEHSQNRSEIVLQKQFKSVLEKCSGARVSGDRKVSRQKFTLQYYRASSEGLSRKGKEVPIVRKIRFSPTFCASFEMKLFERSWPLGSCEQIHKCIYNGSGHIAAAFAASGNDTRHIGLKNQFLGWNHVDKAHRYADNQGWADSFLFYEPVELN